MRLRNRALDPPNPSRNVRTVRGRAHSRPSQLDGKQKNQWAHSLLALGDVPTVSLIDAEGHTGPDTKSHEQTRRSSCRQIRAHSDEYAGADRCPNTVKLYLFGVEFALEMSRSSVYWRRTSHFERRSGWDWLRDGFVAVILELYHGWSSRHVELYGQVRGARDACARRRR